LASRDLGDLIPGLKPKVQELLSKCLSRGVEMRPSATLRDPFEQARLWRQSRSREEIERKIARLREAGAPFLADCIKRVGPQSGRPVTGAAPGLSWHQWGEALDCFWVVNGEAEWDANRLSNGVNGYRVYAGEALQLGLTAGGFWPRFKDWPHVQLRPANSPTDVMTLAEINDTIEARFGHLG
jgi:peptidoglycan L-alanyl-D-glutamate endopeptidase CwlK